jgi:hypothetical protein
LRLATLADSIPAVHDRYAIALKNPEEMANSLFAHSANGIAFREFCQCHRQATNFFQGLPVTVLIITVINGRLLIVADVTPW